MRSLAENRAATRLWIHAVSGHGDNGSPDRGAGAEEPQRSLTLRPQAFVQGSARLCPKCEPRLPRALVHEEATMKSRFQLWCGRGSHRLVSRLAPFRNISGEDH